MASRNFLEPLALVRSPMMRNEVSCSNGTKRVDRGGAGLVLAVRAPGGSRSWHGVDHARRGGRGWCRSSRRRPRTPSSVTKRLWCSASCVGGEVVVHLAVDHRRQAGVGDAGDRHAGVLGEVAEVLAHLDRAGGAVDADDVGLASRRGRRGRRRSRCPGSMRPVSSMVTCTWSGTSRPAARHGPAAADHGRLGAEQVEQGLDDEQVDAALEEPGGLHLVGVAQLGEADLAERGELGAGARSSRRQAGTVRRGDVGAPRGRCGRRPG